LSQRTITAISFLVIGMVIGFGLGIFILTGTPSEIPEDTSLETVANRGTLIVGTRPDYPPFEYLNETEAIVGFDIDLMEYIAAYLNVTVVFQDIELDSLADACEARIIDVIAAAMPITENLASRLQHSIPYFQLDMSVVVMNGSALQISTLDDLSGHTVGVPLGSIEDETMSAIGTVNVVRYEATDLLFEALDAGTVDAVFVETPVVETYTALYNIRTVLQVVTGQRVLYVARPADSLLIEINSAISSGLQDGTIDTLIQEWF
jgi:ABC-type amino acid transport substrate-binding protein